MVYYTKRKLVSIQFQLSVAQETALRRFINQAVIANKAQVDEWRPRVVGDERQDVRVRFDGHSIKMLTQETEKLPSQELKVRLIDISSGGCCVSVHQDAKLVKNGIVTVFFDFMNPPLSLQGPILGLKK